MSLWLDHDRSWLWIGGHCGSLRTKFFRRSWSLVVPGFPKKESKSFQKYKKSCEMETSIVQSKRSLANAPIYLLICVNKELSTAIARPIAPICGFGKEFSRFIAISMARLGRPKRPKICGRSGIVQKNTNSRKVPSLRWSRKSAQIPDSSYFGLWKRVTNFIKI